MVHYYSKKDIEEIRKSALLVSKTLGLVAEKIEPGVTTFELDKLAEEFICDHGGKPAFKGYGGATPFPNTLCMSRNEEVVHGIPSKRPLENGEIVSPEDLVKEVWGAQYANEIGHVRRYIWHLRQKVEVDPENPRYIHNERGFGYLFEVGDGSASQ